MSALSLIETPTPPSLRAPAPQPPLANLIDCALAENRTVFVAHDVAFADLPGARVDHLVLDCHLRLWLIHAAPTADDAKARFDEEMERADDLRNLIHERADACLARAGVSDAMRMRLQVFQIVLSPEIAAQSGDTAAPDAPTLLRMICEPPQRGLRALLAARAPTIDGATVNVVARLLMKGARPNAGAPLAQDDEPLVCCERCGRMLGRYALSRDYERADRNRVLCRACQADPHDTPAR